MNALFSENFPKKILGRSLRTDWDFAGHQRDQKRFAKRLVFFLLFSRLNHRFLILILTSVAAIFGLLHPWFQRHFMDELAHIVPKNIAELIYLCFAGFAAMLLSQVFSFAARLIAAKEAGIATMSLSRAIYRQTISLTSSARADKTVGEIINLYTQDVSAAASLVDEFLVQLSLAIIPMVFAPLFAWYYLGVPLFFTLIMVISVTCIMLAMSWRQSKFFSAFKRLAGERLAVVNEWLQNIRIIRILGWTEDFEDKIKERRVLETDNRLAMVTNGSAMNSLAQVAPIGMTIVAVMFFLNQSNLALTGGVIFALLWIFGVYVSRPIRMMPWNLVIFMDGYTSCKRLESFFKLEIETESKLYNERLANAAGHVESKPKLTPDAIQIKNMNLKLGQKQVFNSIDLEINRGDFVVIVGEVGTGKTQLLLSLLKENPVTWDSFKIFGQKVDVDIGRVELRKFFSYVPQDGFVFSGTLKENVLFSYESNESSDTDAAVYALKKAQFDISSEGLTHGVLTEIGERGVNLSGGQKQRVGLARALYHNADIVLLDDCLSAIDSKTEHDLISDLICGEWKDKTRILVTHRLTVLPYADQVYELIGGRLIPWSDLKHGN